MCVPRQTFESSFSFQNQTENIFIYKNRAENTLIYQIQIKNVFIYNIACLCQLPRQSIKIRFLLSKACT